MGRWPLFPVVSYWSFHSRSHWNGQLWKASGWSSFCGQYDEIFYVWYNTVISIFSLGWTLSYYTFGEKCVLLEKLSLNSLLKLLFAGASHHGCPGGVVQQLLRCSKPRTSSLRPGTTCWVWKCKPALMDDFFFRFHYLHRFAAYFQQVGGIRL